MPIDPLTASSLAMGAASLIQGAVQGNRAKKSRQAFDQTMESIPMQDPGMVSYLGDTRRRRAAFDAGTDPFTSYTKQQIMDQGAQTQANAVRSGRGSLSDLMRVQAGTNAALAGSGALAARRSDQLFNLEGDLVGMMANRAYNRRLADANRHWSEYARQREDSNRAVQAGLGMAMAPLMYGRAKVGDPADVAGSSASLGIGDLFNNMNSMKGFANEP